MASARILSTPQILSEVFNHLEPPVPLTQSEYGLEPYEEDQLEHLRELRRTLAHVARTCRILCEHALAVLWKKVEIPLLFFIIPQFGRCVEGSLFYVSRCVLIMVCPSSVLTTCRYCMEKSLTRPGNAFEPTHGE